MKHNKQPNQTTDKDFAKGKEDYWNTMAGLKTTNTPQTDAPIQQEGYENMPRWNRDSYSSWNEWAKKCFDAGKKEMKSDNEKLEADIERLKKSKDLAMRLALEFGYKECEKGNNIEMALINYDNKFSKHQ
jgi:hypothetical protein